MSKIEKRDIALDVIADDDRTTFVTVQDVEPVIDENAILRAMEQTNTDGLKHFAQIPENVINQWLNEEWAKGNTTMRLWDDEFEFLLARKLDDPDNAKFLVSGPSHRIGWH